MSAHDENGIPESFDAAVVAAEFDAASDSGAAVFEQRDLATTVLAVRQRERRARLRRAGVGLAAAAGIVAIAVSLGGVPAVDRAPGPAGPQPSGPVAGLDVVLTFLPEGTRTADPDATLSPVLFDEEELQDVSWGLYLPTPGEDRLPATFSPANVVSLTFDGGTVSLRGCGLQMAAPAGVVDTRMIIEGEWEIHPDPDPAGTCVQRSWLTPELWSEFFASKPIVMAGDELHLSGTVVNLIPSEHPREWMVLALEGSDGIATDPVTSASWDDLSEGVWAEVGTARGQRVLNSLTQSASPLGANDAVDIDETNSVTLTVTGPGEMELSTGCGPLVLSEVELVNVAEPETGLVFPTLQESGSRDLIGCGGVEGVERELWLTAVGSGSVLRIGDYLAVETSTGAYSCQAVRPPTATSSELGTEPVQRGHLRYSWESELGTIVQEAGLGLGERYHEEALVVPGLSHDYRVMPVGDWGLGQVMVLFEEGGCEYTTWLPGGVTEQQVKDLLEEW